jgi:hypothetical protein
LFGRPYKDELDYIIADILFSEGPLGYKNLKRKVEQYSHSQRSISDGTFSHHLKQMDDKVIMKIGKTYALTEGSTYVMSRGMQIDTRKYRYRNRNKQTD